ncbi:MAG: glycosyl transferase family protein [Sphingopyxis sp.]|nr:glycosyl transferase family protein [Sphingopyxis sp.]
MELSIASLEWLVLGAGLELMLFASVGILLFGLDDLLFDMIWLQRSRRSKARRPLGLPDVEGRFAVFVPAWDEQAVLAATVERMLAAWAGEDVRIYVGCYPNDVSTIFSVSPLIARDQRLRLVVSARVGPTTKGDNLNQLWAALGEDERAEGMRFAAVILHDAEDFVHRGEIALYRDYLRDHAMVQIPVVPVLDPRGRWIGGHYADEFAEAHGKELALRSALGLGLPSAGVGCALSRGALSLLSIERGGQPFRADSLTEDYEVGMLIDAYGLRACFVDAVDHAGDRVVSRGSFPHSVEAAVKQKSRWIAGIAFVGWDYLGWSPGSGSERAEKSHRSWLARWMLWRDRRAPLAAIILLAAYAGCVLVALGWAGEALLGWRPAEIGPAMRAILVINAALLLWRLAMRMYFAGRWYGARQALLSVPRAFVSNIVAILAARRASVLYLQMLRSGAVIWDKTDHHIGEAVALTVRSGRGE